jgi:hypothetical protein
VHFFYFAQKWAPIPAQFDACWVFWPTPTSLNSKLVRQFQLIVVTLFDAATALFGS